MNIIDAIKSGRPFRRKGDEAWKEKASEGDFLLCNAGIIHCLKPDEVVADDWEIQDRTATITRKQADEAILGIVEDMSTARGWFARHVDMYRLFNKAHRTLGLADRE